VQPLFYGHLSCGLGEARCTEECGCQWSLKGENIPTDEEVMTRITAAKKDSKTAKGVQGSTDQIEIVVGFGLVDI
jgi:hypothetical protein